MAYIGASIMVVCSLLNSVGQLLFKSCVLPKGAALGTGVLKNPKFSLGIVIYVVGTLLSIVAYRFADLMILYPLTNLSLVWNLLLAGRLFGERIDAQRITATCMIILGCVVLVY